MRQLKVVRENVKDIEERVLEEMGLKLKRGPKQKRSLKDREGS